jgi:glutaredoxin
METIARRILLTFDQLQRESVDLHVLFEFVGGNVPAQREAVLDSVIDLTEQGLLEADGRSDFYRRTEEGRLVVASPLDVTMYMRDGCHLCEEAKTIMKPILSEFGAKLHEIDIDDDPKLLERYTNDVPVIFAGPEFFAQHRVDPGLLRRRLKSAKNQA